MKFLNVKFFKISLPLVVVFCVYTNISAQAPTDEWRRSGMDAMVAEPGQASSILSNPAGIKTQEERHRLRDDKEKLGKKHEWMVDVFTLDAFLTGRTWDLMSNPNLIVEQLEQQLSLLDRIQNISSGDSLADSAGLTLLRGLGQTAYGALTNGVTGLPSNPADLTEDDLRGLSAGDFQRITDNLKGSALINSLLGEFANILKNALGDLGGEYFSRLFALSHVNDKKPLAWGFYLGFEQKLLYRHNKNLPTPINFTVNDINFKVDLPVSFQAYMVLPIRLAFAHNFDLPGFTFGLSPKVVTYFGLNQDDLGKTISGFLAQTTGRDLNPDAILGQVQDFVELNIGLDFGVQYHFGAITPKLEFLHVGLKISDLIGFNIPLSDKIQSTRYAIDFDLGTYMEYQLAAPIQIFGGLELIQIRGIFGESSPYSALIDPIDHLRLVAGIGFFDNLLRINLQYYNNLFSPAIMLNLGALQLNAAIHLDFSKSKSMGMTLGMRFRGPHNGFNKKKPYKTHPKRTVEKTSPEQPKNEEDNI